MNTKELIQYIVSQLDFSNITKNYFPACNFAIADICDDDTMEDIKANSTGWYGIKAIDPGFDSTFTLYLICDYYGGGCAHFLALEDDDTPEYATEQILYIIRNMMNIIDDIFEDYLLIVEFTEFMGERTNDK